jgi:hypothetical protein
MRLKTLFREKARIDTDEVRRLQHQAAGAWGGLGEGQNRVKFTIECSV